MSLTTPGRPRRLKIPRHRTHPNLLKTTIRVTLAGCGGTGSVILTGLASVDAALKALDPPRQLEVTVVDPDKVSVSNVGRQLFFSSDVGHYKALVLVDRINRAYGTNWKACAAHMTDKGCVSAADQPSVPSIAGIPDILITCVDTAKARALIHNALFSAYGPRATYWLDCGNLATTGKVVLGQPSSQYESTFLTTTKDLTNAVWLGAKLFPHFLGNQNDTPVLRLPCVTELYPELLDPNFVEDNTPSCSLAEALESQSLFVNRMAATWALDLLWQLLREGGVNHQGIIYNLLDGVALPLPLRLWPLRRRGTTETGIPIYPKGALL